MARIDPIASENISPDLRVAFDKHVHEYSARITNIKATLGYSILAFNVYMQWYPLYEKVQQIIGERPAYLYAWSVSNSSNCPLCSTFFRKIIIDKGEKPEELLLSDYESKLLDFGSAIAQHKGCIANHIYNDLAQFHSEEELVVLIAFAGQMIATNVFNNVIETEIDHYLTPYLPQKFNL
jgi:hypothetical protein